MIKESGISKQDQAKNPQAVIDVLGFFTETQKVNGEDHAFSKFTKFDNVYAENLVPEAQAIQLPTTVLPTDSPAVSPKPSPTLPKRPVSPLKPPRKSSTTNSKEDLKLSDEAKVNSSTKVSAPPLLPPKPVLQKDSRPPVPARPAHTLGIGSTDVKPVVPSGSVSQKTQQFEQAQKLSTPPPKPPLETKPLVSSSENGPSSLPSKPQIRQRPKASLSTEDIIIRLRAICNPVDPTKLYRNLVKIGQGASGGVYTAKSLDTGKSVAIKQMNLNEQPKKDLIINEILVMKAAKHKNIVNFIDSFLFKGDLWVVMEYMEGGSLTETVTTAYMTEEQISIVCREVELFDEGIGRTLSFTFQRNHTSRYQI
jgi:p21-activated kinase 1